LNVVSGFLQGKTFWRFSVLICSSVACSCIIISKI